MGDRDDKGISAYELALNHHRNGRLEEAAFFYRQALKDIPEDARVHHDLGVLYYQCSDHSNALKCFENSVYQDPALAEAEFNKANTLVKMKRTAEALAAYRRAVEIRPQYHDAHYNLAFLYKEMGDYKQAVRHFRAALNLRPDCCETLNALGVVHLNLADYDDALSCFRKVVSLNPGHVQSLYNLGLALKRKGDAEQAISVIRSVLELKPDFYQAVALLVSLLQQTCAWQELANAQAALDEITRNQLRQRQRPTETPFLSFSRKATPEHNFEVAKAWSRHIQRMCPTSKYAKGHSASSQRSKITIGYLSEQFRDAATSHLMASLFEIHDRSRFKINAYSLGRDDRSSYRCKIEQGVDNFIDIRSLSIEEAAGRIHDDGVDVLVDLIGWMHGHRIMIPAMRPAPIQVNYLGYPGTSGAAFMDYILADRIVIPPEHQPFFTEKVVYLPHCFQVTDPHPAVAGSGITRADCGLPDDGMVYCSFCTDYKIDQMIFAAWMQILASVPGSVLWLIVRTDATAKNLRQAAFRAGVDPDRLIFAPALPKDQHLERLMLADLALDTAVVNGHTTTTDALWAGVPVLTLQGGHFASRVASSLIRTMGLSDLVKPTIKEYIDFAVQLGIDGDKLASIALSVKRNRQSSVLFDIQGFARGLETAFLQMREIHLRGEPPHAFDVSIH